MRPVLALVLMIYLAPAARAGHDILTEMGVSTFGATGAAGWDVILGWAGWTGRQALRTGAAGLLGHALAESSYGGGIDWARVFLKAAATAGLAALMGPSYPAILAANAGGAIAGLLYNQLRALWERRVGRSSRPDGPVLLGMASASAGGRR